MGLMIRHNSVLNGDIIIQNFNQIMINRIVISLGALVLVLLAIFLYEQKEGGILMFGQSFQNCLVLIKENFKLSTLTNLICSIILLCMVPLIQGVANLDRISTAICLENYVAIIG